MPLIETHNLIKTYGYAPVLKKVTLEIERGEFVALLGPNGSGKSTFIRLIAGLSRPTGGIIRVGGWDLPGEAFAVRHQIGLVSHKSLLYDNLTAYENLRFFARLYNLEDADAQIMAMLDRVGLKLRAYDLVRTFSRGMLQRLSIGRALLHNPDVLLFDEPYTGLDQDAGAILDDLLQVAHDGQRTIVMATHQLDRASKQVDRAVILRRGQIVLDQPMSAIEDLPRTYADVTEMASPR